MKKTNNKGFSLVELIIVIAIMAILIGVLAPQYIKYVEKSRRSADVDLLDSVYTACSVACSDPEITNAPTSNTTGKGDDITAKIVNTDNGWGAAVLTTLGVNNISAINGKLKSKDAKPSGGGAASVKVYINKNGNITVEAGSITVPNTSGS